MCPGDDSHLTLEFGDHYVLQPTIKFFDRENAFTTNALGEEGKPVSLGFEYNSGANDHFLTVDEIVEFNRMAMA